MTDKWKETRKRQIKEQIEKLADKLSHIAMDLRKYSDRRGGIIKHYKKMAFRSLIATRKKVYKLQEELRRL